MTPCINICAPGYWDTADSYGIIASNLARQLTARGCVVNAYALGDTRFENQPPDIQTITANPRRAALGGIFLGYPTGYYKHGALTAAGPRLALTMFESSRIPAGWAEILNRMDAVITPSQFCAEVFRRGGVTIPIHVVPLGINPAYTYAPRKPDRPLTFLSFVDRGPRKGGWLALNAFVGAFGDRDDVRLILKCRHRDKPPRVGNANVTVIVQDYTEAELHALYLSADALIAPTTGEGFGLLPREFAATGGISLATHWSGTAEEIDLWGVPLGYTLVTARWDSKALADQDCGEWANVPREGLTAALRRVADNLDWYRMRAKRNAPHVAARYTWDAFGTRVLELWQEVADGYRHGLRTAA